MNKAILIVAALVMTTSCSTRTPAPSTTPAVRVTALADTFMAAYFERNPESVTYYGIPNRRHDRLFDNSPAAARAWEAREDAWLREVHAIDAASLAGTPAAVAYGILKETLEASVASRVCRGELWGLNQLVGWQSNLGYLASIQPVGTDQARTEALARWRALPRFIDTEIANLREGVRIGFTAPRQNAQLVLQQIDALRSGAVTESPLYGPATRDSTPVFQAAVAQVIEQEINPALQRYRDYLEKEYLPQARTSIAVSALPSGADCYRASVRQFSTLEVPAEEVHRLGLQQMARIESEMKAIAERSFATSDVRGLLDKLKTDTQYTFRTREEIMEHSRAAIARAEREMPKWFGILPKAKVVVERYPEFREKSAVGEYNAPAEDGSRPGVFLISTYEPTKRSRSGPESVAFHEAIPGHHLQIAIAMERGSANHPIARYMGNSGYSEGWALYSERLAEEMGLFTADIDRIGMLSEQALRAARLVVDPGMHVLGWTRDQAIEYMAQRTTMPREEIVSEVDRYIVWPGQATAYMLGMLEIQRLRDHAQRELGSRFDIKAFHDRILEDGSVPLPTLRAKIDRWIASVKAGH
jgi:uncharacterized protein (DUF885 family)